MCKKCLCLIKINIKKDNTGKILENRLDRIPKIILERFNITDIQYTKYEKYYEILNDKNKVMNLTAITDYEGVFIKHFYDSLLLTEITKDYDNFIDEISRYPTFNKELDYLYFNEYKKTNNYVLALNKVNHPNFYKTTSSQIMFDNIMLINKFHGVDSNFTPDNLVVVEKVDHIKRPNEVMYIDQNALLNYQDMVNDAINKSIPVERVEMTLKMTGL